MTLQNPLQNNLNQTINASQLADHGSAFAVITLGVVLVLFTLFSPLSQVHNATHDTRHAVVAPCH
jgi:cobalt transporter subunit CbtB